MLSRTRSEDSSPTITKGLREAVRWVKEKHLGVGVLVKSVLDFAAASLAITSGTHTLGNVTLSTGLAMTGGTLTVGDFASATDTIDAATLNIKGAYTESTASMTIGENGTLALKGTNQAAMTVKTILNKGTLDMSAMTTYTTGAKVLMKDDSEVILPTVTGAETFTVKADAADKTLTYSGGGIAAGTKGTSVQNQITSFVATSGTWAAPTDWGAEA